MTQAEIEIVCVAAPMVAENAELEAGREEGMVRGAQAAGGAGVMVPVDLAASVVFLSHWHPHDGACVRRLCSKWCHPRWLCLCYPGS